MSLQLIFCVETNKSTDSDYIYIRDTLDRFYTLDNTIKITPLYATGKGNFMLPKFSKKIISLKKKYKDITGGESIVIFCVDTDNLAQNSADFVFFEKIKKFSVEQGYELVWFCKCIEEVYVGSCVNKGEKGNCAIHFRKSRLIEKVHKEKLLQSSYKIKHSNILLVLQKYLSPCYTKK